MKKGKSFLSLFLVIAVTVLFGVSCMYGVDLKGTGAAKNINLGLDLEGGVSITYQVKGDNPSQKDMDDTVYKLQKRVEQYSTEAQAYQVGDNRISIEIPGVNDANAILEELGQPGSLYFIKHKNSAGEENYTLGSSGYVLNKTIDELKESDSIVLSGSEVKTASAGQISDSTTGSKEYGVDLELTTEGAEKFKEATQEAVSNSNDTIAIYYDGELISVPKVNTVIENGKAQITGSMTYEEADNIASTIRIGGLNVELEELSSEVVGAQLGQEAVSTSLIAGAIGLALVCIFMCWVYLLPGLAASMALLLYTEITLLFLNAFDITLTLPGIAGIILGIGMAVDANVIIFARVKEELTAGKSVHAALQSGFHKAMSAIIDGNVTTLIAAGVLWLRGSGSVKGFAQTLALGIVISMFTALVITRLIIFSFYGAGIHNVKAYGRHLKERKPFDFLGKKKIFFVLSIILCLCGPVMMGVNHARGIGAMNYSLDFVGGTSTNVTFDKEYTLDEIDKNMIATICMLLYIWFRFKDIRFATSAVIALVHDVLVVLGFYVIARVSVGNTFIAVMLTIVGYSINGTIVIFDRIREELKTKSKAEDLKDLVNRCITQTLTRTIYTNITTFIMVVVLYILGVSSIKEFAAPLMVGIVCGAYTSVCITGALWYVMKTKIGTKAATVSNGTKAIADTKKAEQVDSSEAPADGNTAKSGKKKGKKKSFKDKKKKNK